MWKIWKWSDLNDSDLIRYNFDIVPKKKKLLNG